MLHFKEISRILKQRAPFIFVDRVVEINAGNSILAEKNITCNEAFLSLHFPDNPIYPGVYIIEMVAQTTAILCSYSEELQYNPEEQILVLAGIQRFQFMKPVKPGDVLRAEVQLIKEIPQAAIVKAKVIVDEAVVAEGQLTFGVASNES